MILASSEVVDLVGLDWSVLYTSDWITLVKVHLEVATDYLMGSGSTNPRQAP
jgi:hypothetical protein